MNNILSYCGLVDARIRASEKDLPVTFDDLFHTYLMQEFQKYARNLNPKMAFKGQTKSTKDASHFVTFFG